MANPDIISIQDGIEEVGEEFVVIRYSEQPEDTGDRG